MKKKYQIFVSSTYQDLKEERDLVIKAILEMGHIPVGMEMFSAGDEQQWKLIQTQIDDCDYYIVISAFRYGSLDGDTGYTEKEYDYAVSKKIPVLGFVIQDGVSWPSNRMDSTPLLIEKLSSFKAKIKNKLISPWSDKNDLYGKVSIALMKQFNTNPQAGWIKSTEQTGPEVLKEISRLSTENSELRKKLESLKEQSSREKKDDFQRIIDTLKHNERKLAFAYEGGKGREDISSVTMMRIFYLLAPELMIESSTKHCSWYLGYMLRPNKARTVIEEWALPFNTVNRIFADFNALNLIKPSTKKHTVKDDNDYWTITEYGKDIYKNIVMEILEKNLDQAVNNDTDDGLKQS